MMLLKLIFLVVCLLLSTATTLADEESSPHNTAIKNNNNSQGHAALLQGQQLLQQGHYTAASSHLWRAVVLHSSDDASSYTVNDAFSSFLQCYIRLNRLSDAFTFVAAESYLRGQYDMGQIYLEKALELQQQQREHKHSAVVRLRDIVEQHSLDSVATLNLIKEVRDMVDASFPPHDEQDIATHNNNSSNDTDNSILRNDKFDISNLYNHKEDDSFTKETTSLLELQQQSYPNTTPEQLYNIGTHHFNTRNLPQAERLFQLSCIQSNFSIAPACTNAVYLRSTLCLWGMNGTGFERDMEVVRRVMRGEVELYRSVKRRQLYNNNDDDDDDGRMMMEKKLGINPLRGHNDYILWNRATAIHPHMMLGYPLGNEDAILKRYSSESLASLDELRARAEYGDGTNIRELPSDLPYSVEEMRDMFVKKNEVYKSMYTSLSDSAAGAAAFAPIKVGFVACGFNSKAVLYLSHDMFRFFDPDIVEIHIFSSGQPDAPQFIQNTMRGVDWRQRVMDTVDYFHDVREYKDDHIGLARYIHDLEIQILIEWDGYARQGDRAAGLMALRPAPIQILHQEFLMTSGAQYIDYIVTDKNVSPLRLEGLYTEKFLWLPNHFFSKGHAMQKELHPPQLEYLPKERKESEFQLGVGSPQENACLSSNPLGSNASSNEVSFVYCNFNKFLKHNPETVRSWIRILEQVPNSILCLLENPVEGIPNLRQFVTETSSNNGDDKADLNDRIHFLPWEKNPFDHQRRSYSLCNAMLDSHPYNGHTTAQDALYAGVPIVTRSDGDDMSSRVSTSANVVLGLEEMNAYQGVEEYENIAIRLGADKEWFASIRTKLIESCLQKNPMHPYWDLPRYVNNFQSGLKTIWANFLSGNEMEHVEVKEEEGKQGTTEIEIVAREEKRKNVKDGRPQKTSSHRNERGAEL